MKYNETIKAIQVKGNAMDTTTITTGSILVSSWGYDQPNIDYYEVVKMTTKNVWLRRLDDKKTYLGDMHGISSPVIGQYKSRSVVSDTNEPFMRKIQFMSWNGQDEPFVAIKSHYIIAHLWDGTPRDFSEWA